jgi:hypothetical protein
MNTLEPIVSQLTSGQHALFLFFFVEFGIDVEHSPGFEASRLSRFQRLFALDFGGLTDVSGQRCGTLIFMGRSLTGVIEKGRNLFRSPFAPSLLIFVHSSCRSCAPSRFVLFCFGPSVNLERLYISFSSPGHFLFLPGLFQVPSNKSHRLNNISSLPVLSQGEFSSSYEPNHAVS